MIVFLTNHVLFRDITTVMDEHPGWRATVTLFSLWHGGVCAVRERQPAQSFLMKGEHVGANSPRKGKEEKKKGGKHLK